MQNISDNIRTYMVSLSNEFECVLLGGSSVQNTSDNIHTDMVFLWYVSVYDVTGDSSVRNISDKIHTDKVSALCELIVCGMSGFSPL